MITDTYGIPSYLEANPSVVGVVTFPFMFGMMFGDMGHGSLILTIGILLIAGAEKLRETSLAPVLFGRYHLFLMGFFSVYCGFIYNEWFAIVTNFFPSCYDIQNRTVLGAERPGANAGSTVADLYIFRRTDYYCTYPMGVDPAWGISGNGISFINNFKMKLSVVIGVVHMTIGILCKGTNALYFKDMPSLVFEVIVGLVILLGLFGWMDALVIAKWFFPIDLDNNLPANAAALPEDPTTPTNGDM